MMYPRKRKETWDKDFKREFDFEGREFTVHYHAKGYNDIGKEWVYRSESGNQFSEVRLEWGGRVVEEGDLNWWRLMDVEGFENTLYSEMEIGTEKGR